MIIFGVLVLLVVALRMVYWTKMNPARYQAKRFVRAFLWKLVFYITDVGSNLLFSVYFFVTMYWFITYKMQENAHILMPQRNIDNSTYDFFFRFLVVILVAKTVAILMSIIDQSASTDIFVIDWERYEQMKLVEVVE